MSWDFEDGDGAYHVYKQLGHTSEFWQLRPEISPIQQDLLNAFFLARKDCEIDQPLPTALIKYHLSSVQYEEDWAIWILRRIDDHHAELRAEKRDLDRQRMNNNGR